MPKLVDMGVKVPKKLENITIQDLHTIQRAINTARKTNKRVSFCSCCCSSS